MGDFIDGRVGDLVVGERDCAGEAITVDLGCFAFVAGSFRFAFDGERESREARSLDGAFLAGDVFRRGGLCAGDRVTFAGDRSPLGRSGELFRGDRSGESLKDSVFLNWIFFLADGII